jgi:hypothetical protein
MDIQIIVEDIWLVVQIHLYVLKPTTQVVNQITQKLQDKTLLDPENVLLYVLILQIFFHTMIAKDL